MQLLINVFIYLILSKCMLCTINSAVNFKFNVNWYALLTEFFMFSEMAITYSSGMWICQVCISSMEYLRG